MVKCVLRDFIDKVSRALQMELCATMASHRSVLCHLALKRSRNPSRAKSNELTHSGPD